MSETQSPNQYKHTNRLIHETSPYLLQHAHNPVDWHPWSEETLHKAQQEDKPILLSVGYSACHWCHVMERESFENEQIAAIMNQYFVPIKVDREERPDIDTIYMRAVQAMTQHGGWPMTVFLMPDGRPFYGGTYFPPQDRSYGGNTRVPDFSSILLSLAKVYQEQRAEVEEQATQLVNFLKQQSDTPLRARVNNLVGVPQLSMLLTASQKLAEAFDKVDGGFGTAPKFPSTMALEFLLRVHLHQRDGELPPPQEQSGPSELEIVELSLEHIAHGGIYDQLGGGFHRYSVDDKWLVPHFEKMLYDNALLSRIYLHTYLVTGNPLYSRIAEETLDYVVREMTSPEGGFYSTQDADSEGEEGKFFLWTTAEVTHDLTPKDASLFIRYYSMTDQGNFEGKNILHVRQNAQKIAEESEITPEELQASLKRSREALFAVREKRVKPGRDDKILTSWNGLMLRSFAEAARYLRRPDYLQVATKNATFLLSQLRQDGRLLRTYKDGRAHLNGYLEDYAFLADSLLALYEASFDIHWFAEARALMDQAIELFTDEQHGGFFDTGKDHEILINRPKDIMDNAIPAGNSIAMDVLQRLSTFSGISEYQQRADEYLQSIADVMVQYPLAFGHVLGVLDFAISPHKEFAIIGDLQVADTQALLAVINTHYLPNSVLASASPTDIRAGAIIALLADRPSKDGKATAYVCQNFTCQASVTRSEELACLL